MPYGELKLYTSALFVRNVTPSNNLENKTFQSRLLKKKTVGLTTTSNNKLLN